MGKSFERVLRVPRAADDVAQRVHDVLRQARKVKGVWMTPPNVTAKLGVSMVSWGELVTVRITPVYGGTEVTIRSESALPTQIVDWGRNKKNVEYVVAAL